MSLNIETPPPIPQPTAFILAKCSKFPFNIEFSDGDTKIIFADKVIDSKNFLILPDNSFVSELSGKIFSISWGFSHVLKSGTATSLRAQIYDDYNNNTFSFPVSGVSQQTMFTTFLSNSSVTSYISPIKFNIISSDPTAVLSITSLTINISYYSGI